MDFTASEKKCLLTKLENEQWERQRRDEQTRVTGLAGCFSTGSEQVSAGNLKMLVVIQNYAQNPIEISMGIS